MSRIALPPYPKGWYQLATTQEIPKGTIKALKFFGKDLVVYRLSNGQAQVADAHCPHLGAHLGVGGKIVGDTLRCPFHGWEFGKEGECTKIPYCEDIPKQAKLKIYATREAGHSIFMYYSMEDLKPDFEVPVYKEFEEKGWSKPTHLRYRLASHVQEMAENTLDTGHFPLIHGYHKVPNIVELENSGPNLMVRFLGHRKVFGTTNKMDVTLDAWGLGVVLGKTETNYLSVRVIHAATPIDEKEIEVNLTYVYKKSRNPLFNMFMNFMLPREVLAFTKGDHAVLNHKIYRPAPLLCQNDGPIFRLRRWAKQFYEERKAA